MIVRLGIADAHGIESYFTEDECRNNNLFTKLFLRAQANRQRHAVLYRVIVDDDVDKKVLGLLKEKKNAEALSVLKEEASYASFPQCTSSYEQSWEQIPNPKLDPYN